VAYRPQNVQPGAASGDRRELIQSGGMGEHLLPLVVTAIQLGVTIWQASITRHISLSMYGTRLEAHREAVKIARELWMLDKKTDADATAKINHAMDWIALNAVFLEPAAEEAFMAVHLFKVLQGDQMPAALLKEHHDKADRALETLRRELLRFRKRTLWQRVVERFRNEKGSSDRPDPTS
jgi:hypothetical protein